MAPPISISLDDYPDAVVASSPAGVVLHWNDAAERMFGYAAAEALGQPLQALIVPADRAEESARWSRTALEQGQARYETVRRTRDGIALDVDVAQTAVRNPETGATYLLATERDISRLGCLREARFLEARFRGLLEAAPDAMVIVDQEGRISLVNSQTERLLGYAREELLGRPVELLVPEHARGLHRDHRQGYPANPQPRPMGRGLDLYARRRDGTVLPVEISLSPLATEEGVLVTAAIRDMTERKRLEERRRQADERAVRQAQEASRLKSEFVAHLSHELRTPLNAVMGFAQLLHDRRTGTLSERQSEFVDDILAASGQLLHLIDDVLDLAKVEAGRLDFRPEPVDVAALANDVRETLRGLADARQVEVAIEIDPDLGSVEVDPGRLRQVLYNYVSNALKFSPAASRVVLRGRGAGESFRVEVEDRGPGIRPEDQKRLFMEFQQLEPGSSNEHSGTGLGLALTKRLVEAQGGRVGVESVPGRGSVFSAVLPRRTRREAPDPGEPLEVEGTAQDLPREGPVLVVDDNPVNLKLTQMVLSSEGYEVRTARDAAEAIVALESCQPCIVLMDLQLPGIDGLGLTRLLKADPATRDIPILAVTASAMKGDEERAIAAGCDGYVAKPVDTVQLLQKMARCLSRPSVNP